jgi:hypothetical protein
MLMCLAEMLHLYDIFYHVDFAMLCMHHTHLGMQFFHTEHLCILNIWGELNPNNFELLARLI